MRLATFTALVGTGAAVFGSAQAQGDFYLGNWKIVSAVVAPWADPVRTPDVAERARLIGRTIVIKAHAITGPPPFACPGAHHKVIDYASDMLFQGAFDEMRSKNKAVDPNRLAASLGFGPPPIKTLETGCEFDFHFVDKTTAELGLNDYAYTLKKQ